MIPFTLLAVAGYLALTRGARRSRRPPRPERRAAARRGRGAAAGGTGSGWRPLRQSAATASIRSVAAAGAIGLIILGAAPMAAAQASPVADTILAQAINGVQRPGQLPGPGLPPHRPARPGRDAGQPARQGGAADLPGPVLAGLPADRAGVPPGRAAARRDTRQVELVAINYNPLYTQRQLHPGVRPAGRPGRRAELAVPDRHPGPAAPGLARATACAGGDPARPGRWSGTATTRSSSTRPATCARNWASTPAREPRPPNPSFAAELTDAAQQLLGQLMSRPPGPGRRAGPGRRGAHRAGCGSAAPAAPARRRGAAGRAAVLATSLVTAAGTWAVAVMGGSGRHAQQLLAAVRPPGRQPAVEAGHPARGRRQRRPGPGRRRRQVADHRVPAQPVPHLHPADDHPQRRPGLVISRARSTPALANVPDALAAAPGTGRLLALLTGGTAKLAAPGYTRWTTLATQPSLAATPAGRRCGLQTSPPPRSPRPGTPLLAGTCSHPGTAGIFAGTGGTWHAAGPALPAALAAQHVQVLRLTRTTAARSRCSRQAPGQPPACSPPGPQTAAATGPCRPRSGCTARRPARHPSAPATRPRSC